MTSWGGNILLADDGKYHLWASRMADGAGLDTWGHQSQIDHAVADDPMGVFACVRAASHSSSCARSFTALLCWEHKKLLLQNEEEEEEEEEEEGEEEELE